jgi:hypothetical protein
MRQYPCEESDAPTTLPMPSVAKVGTPMIMMAIVGNGWLE